MNVYHIYFYESGLTHSKWFFSIVSSICCIFSCHFLNSWLTFQCKMFHIFYSLFCWGTCSSFQISQLWIEQQRTWLSNCQWHWMKDPLSIFPTVNIWSLIDWFSFFWGTDILIFILGVQVCTLTSNVWMVFYTFLYIMYCTSFPAWALTCYYPLPFDRSKMKSQEIFKESMKNCIWQTPLYYKGKLQKVFWFFSYWY